MVTMVYSDQDDMDSRIAKQIRYFSGWLFTGPRSFIRWESAVAYALLPADPKITVIPRRRVRRGSSGRWIVMQTFLPRRSA